MDDKGIAEERETAPNTVPDVAVTTNEESNEKSQQPSDESNVAEIAEAQDVPQESVVENSAAEESAVIENADSAVPPEADVPGQGEEVPTVEVAQESVEAVSEAASATQENAARAAEVEATEATDSPSAEISGVADLTESTSPREKVIDAVDPISVSEEGTNTTLHSEGYIQSYTTHEPGDSEHAPTSSHEVASNTITEAVEEDQDQEQTDSAEAGQGDSANEESASPPPPPPPEYDDLDKPNSPPQQLVDVPHDLYVTPGLKVIDVEIDQGPGVPHRLIRIIIDYAQLDNKPYIGGFRNKRTDVIYHHAFTQTPRKPKYTEKDRKLSRETQTVKNLTRSQQTQREQGTQMARPGVLLDESEDRELTPKPYVTADEVWAKKEAATRTIQRFVRGWFGRRRAAELRKQKEEREAFLAEQEAKRIREMEEQRRKEIDRRMHPRTAADFEILYNELEAWRIQETRKIKDAAMGPEKEHEALQQLLYKETKLLQTIDRLKIEAHSENKEVRIHKMLNNMAQPKVWSLKNGNTAEVHTPFTTRAKELMQLYEGLNLPMLTIDERLDVLLHVKWTVKEFECNLTREIVDLIDREADLLNRGRNPRTLEGLRSRISSLFLTFIETPEFNPEAAHFQVVPMDFETYVYERVDKASARSMPVTVNATAKYA